MDIEELAEWLYNGHRFHIIGGFLNQSDWKDIRESARERWRNYARIHKKVFHAGDKADT